MTMIMFAFIANVNAQVATETIVIDYGTTEIDREVNLDTVDVDDVFISIFIDASISGTQFDTALLVITKTGVDLIKVELFINSTNELFINGTTDHNITTNDLEWNQVITAEDVDAIAGETINILSSLYQENFHLDLDLSFVTDYTFTANPSNAQVCNNINQVELTSAAPILTNGLQWQVNSGSGFTNLSNNSTYAGVNNDTLIITDPSLSLNTNIYRCASAYNSNTYYTAEATLSVNDAPVTDNIIGNPNPDAYETFTYVVTNTTGSTYEWQVIGGAIAADNGNSVNIMWSVDGFGSLCVTETATNACPGDEVCLNIMVNVNDIATESNFNIYPNPTTGNVQIQNAQNSTIEILNIAGKSIKTINATTQNTEIDLSTEPKGLYLVKVTTANGVTTQKLILE